MLGASIRAMITFFRSNGFIGFAVLGAVFLVVTGGEALYADMGHFGKEPIRLAWFALVLPSLLLNYLGQGPCFCSTRRRHIRSFNWRRRGHCFRQAIATVAAIIASQALISGAFSITRQAMQLDWRRGSMSSTSAQEIGQIYVPQVNWALMFACVFIVIGFGSSSDLAAAHTGLP